MPAHIAAALKATPVTVVPQAQDVEMADAGVAGTTAGVSLQSVLRKPVCVQINATQCIPKSHRVTYSVGTKSGSAKGVKAITEAITEAAMEVAVMLAAAMAGGSGGWQWGQTWRTVWGWPLTHLKP